MESAIDTHLKCPRTLSKRVGEDYEPPFPMWAGRMDRSVTQVVMAHYGVQYRAQETGKRDAALKALSLFADHFSLENGPGHFDLVTYCDAQGYDTLIAIAYWTDVAAFARWEDTPAIRGWWEDEARLTEELGYFREILRPRTEQFETLYAYTERLPGVGAVMQGVSAPVHEHGYWGSMRDRFPLSQTDRMAPRGDLQLIKGTAGRVRVAGHDNLCLIRSGQEWQDTDEDERRLYLDAIEPTLRAGMDFLCDEGAALGCYSNRYVRHIDLAGVMREESFDLGHWRSLERLERWAESHPTHLRIFTTFFRVAASLNKLRLYHEVLVVDADDQRYDYIACHPATGLMRDARPAD